MLGYSFNETALSLCLVCLTLVLFNQELMAMPSPSALCKCLLGFDLALSTCLVCIFFSISIFPAVCLALILYYSQFLIPGPRQLQRVYKTCIGQYYVSLMMCFAVSVFLLITKITESNEYYTVYMLNNLSTQIPHGIIESYVFLSRIYIHSIVFIGGFLITEIYIWSHYGVVRHSILSLVKHHTLIIFGFVATIISLIQLHATLENMMRKIVTESAARLGCPLLRWFPSFIIVYIVMADYYIEVVLNDQSSDVED